MARPATISAKNALFGLQLPANDPTKGNKVYASPTHNITYKSQGGNTEKFEYKLIFDTKTKQSIIYRQTRSLGANNPLRAAEVVAIKEKNSAVFVATTWAEDPNNVPPQILVKLTDPQDPLQSNLGTAFNYTVKSGLCKDDPANCPATYQQVAAAAGISSVTPPPPPPPPPGTTPPPTPMTTVGDGTLDDLLTSAGAQEKVLSFAAGTDDLIYPEGALGDESDYIKFSALKYLPSRLSNSQASWGATYQKGTEINQSVQLPIQSGIQDSNGVGWNEDTMNLVQAAGADIAVATIGDGISAGVNSLLEAAKSAKRDAGPLRTAITDTMAGQAVGSNIMARRSRAILNPNTELLFQGPQLRAFSFSFKLTPRSETEARIVKSIIKFFKFHMAPKTTSSNIFLKAPNIFRLEYFNRGKQFHSGINLIKDCALQSCNVDYTPDGTYMAYDDGAMFSYDLQLQFMELIPLYAKDYNEGEGANHPIGY